MSRTWVEISLSRLKHNLGCIRELSQDSPVIAVVKANAYGHGVRRVAETLWSQGVRSFGVAELGEARELRLHLPEADILVFGGCNPGEELEFERCRLTAAVYSDAIPPSPIGVELKLETGMGRLGLSPDALPALIGELGERVRGIYTTLSSADFDPVATRAQISRFEAATAGLGVRRHLSNSAGLAYPEARFDAVRPGLALYGIANAEPLKKLLPILTWKARVLAVNQVPAGAAIGYGGTFVTSRASRIAVLGVGYADGYSRRWSGLGKVGLRGGFAPVVGRVSMDLISVDVTDLDETLAGDTAVLVDSDPDSPISVAALARTIGTIPYEILTTIGRRVERVYVDA